MVLPSNSVPSGRPISLKDYAKDPKSYVGRSLRVSGFLRLHNPVTNEAQIEYEGVELDLFTDLCPISFDLGTRVECIGEVERPEKTGLIRLRPRIVRNINTIDSDLYEKVVSLVASKLDQPMKSLVERGADGSS